MEYSQLIEAARQDARQLEGIYQKARQQGETEQFKNAFSVIYQTEPDNPLFQAWHYRLEAEPGKPTTGEGKRLRHWAWAIPLAILNGLIFWGITDESWQFLDTLPYFVLLWAPIAAMFVLGFLLAFRQDLRRRTLILATLLVLAVLYVLLLAPTQSQSHSKDYLVLMIFHLPMLAWIAVGFQELGWRSKANERFAFLIKSLEVFVTAGVYTIVGGIFSGITIGMFAALGINLSEPFFRLIFGGGGGLIPVIATVSMYNPELSPISQDFSQGLSRFVATLMRLVIPLTLIVLVIYIVAIPFNFMEPFKNREVLIIYNVMLFAIMGLLIGATPIDTGELSPGWQETLRLSILAVAILTLLVSAYAMSATLYRTIQGGITINRMTIIGWNTINIAILGILVYRQYKPGDLSWTDNLKATFKLGTIGYVFWLLFTLLGIPLLFG